MIRKVEKQDLMAIAKIHKENFGDHFLGKFSEKLIFDFYHCFLGGENFIANFSDNGECTGFILGGDSKWLQACSAKFLTSYKCEYVVEILLRPNTWMDTILRVYKMVIQKMVSFSNTKNANLDKLNISSYRLLSIAVKNNHQHVGIASELVAFYEKNCPESSYGLTVHANNWKAIRFYRKMQMFEAYRTAENVGFEKQISPLRINS